MRPSFVALRGAAACLVLLVSSVLAGCAAQSRQASCPVAAVPFANGVEVLRATRVVTTAAGESGFEPVTFQGVSKAFFRPGELFTSTTFGAASKVQLVSGPPNLTLPPHPAPGREMFLTLQGSSVVTLPDGRELALGPGDLVIFEDMTSRSGHGGRTGPCGYVALNIVPAVEAAAAPAAR